MTLDRMVSDKKMFSCFPYIKHVTPGQDQFRPQGHNLNKLGLGQLGYVSYQISRGYALWFQLVSAKNIFFMFTPI